MSASSDQWTPREALVAMLREIDDGNVAPDALVICFKQGTNPGFLSAAPDVITMIGVVEGVKLLIHDESKAR